MKKKVVMEHGKSPGETPDGSTAEAIPKAPSEQESVSRHSSIERRHQLMTAIAVMDREGRIVLRAIPYCWATQELQPGDLVLDTQGHIGISQLRPFPQPFRSARLYLFRLYSWWSVSKHRKQNKIK